MRKPEWLGYNLVKSHDDRLSRLGTKHQRVTQTESHVATANAAPTHCVGRQKNGWSSVTATADNIIVSETYPEVMSFVSVQALAAASAAFTNSL